MRNCVVKQLNSLVEPHITLKAQGGLTSDERWIETLQNVCKNFNSFQVSLGKPMYFGEHILYLSVYSHKIRDLHEKIIHEISPSPELIKQYFELEHFVPHLTLGKVQYGLSKQELKDMEKLAENELTPYPNFSVKFIRIYHLNLDKHKYEKYVDIHLRETN